MKQLTIRLLLLCILSIINSNVFAGVRFKSAYSCNDISKVCVSKGKRQIEGFEVEKGCWEYSYQKICSYPSLDNCKIYDHCYWVKNVGCLLQDSQGSCVNMKKEYSCKSWQPVTKENKTARTGFKEKEGEEGLVCVGIPCIDGNCFDKSYLTNGEMMDALSKLSIVSNMQTGGKQKVDLFAGSNNHCSKKATGYSNCCQEAGKGWGSQVGSRCQPHEIELAKKRSENKCVYVGKQNKGSMKTVVKHQYCCFPTLLDKVVQVEARKQLGRGWGSPGNPDCRGLTLEDIQRVDFSKMDLSEFIDDFKVKFAGKFKSPDSKELTDTIESSISSIRQYDDNPNNPDNNKTGWNKCGGID